MKLKPGEVLIIDEGKTGWGATLALTNKRLLVLNQERIIGETPIENISEAYSATQAFANLTQLKIKPKKRERNDSDIQKQCERSTVWRFWVLKQRYSKPNK